MAATAIKVATTKKEIARVIGDIQVVIGRLSRDNPWVAFLNQQCSYTEPDARNLNQKLVFLEGVKERLGSLLEHTRSHELTAGSLEQFKSPGRPQYSSSADFVPSGKMPDAIYPGPYGASGSDFGQPAAFSREEPATGFSQPAAFTPEEPVTGFSQPASRKPTGYSNPFGDEESWTEPARAARDVSTGEWETTGIGSEQEMLDNLMKRFGRLATDLGPLLNVERGTMPRWHRRGPNEPCSVAARNHPIYRGYFELIESGALAEGDVKSVMAGNGLDPGVLE